jgi:hypothetical protein
MHLAGQPQSVADRLEYREQVVRSKDAIPFKNGRLFHDRTSFRRTVLHTTLAVSAVRADGLLSSHV